MAIDYQLLQNSVYYGAILDLSPTSRALAILAVGLLDKRYSWSINQQSLSDSEWDELDAIISLTLDELMSSLVGMVFPSVLATNSALKTLPCDGGVYEKTDYPLLYDAIDPVYIISANSFRVPDLRDRTIVGSGGSYGVDEGFGVDTVTLSIAQMPSHTHGSNYPSVGIDIEGAGVPDVTAVSNPPLTTPTTSAGGNQPHENRQPSRALQYVIVAG